MSNTSQNRTSTRGPALLQAMCLAMTCLYPGVSFADDTEIYFAQPLSTEQSMANIMFMFDTSGSMQDRDDGPDSPRRIDQLKQAMVDVVDSANNVSIGLGAFNGVWAGGSVLYPSTNVDLDLCPDASCTSHEIRVPITLPEDDAVQDGNGNVSLHDDTLRFELTDTGSNLIGLRFSDLNIPRGATINHAALEFSTANADAVATTLTIVGQNVDDAPVFASTPNELSTRIVSTTGQTTASVSWNAGAWKLGHLNNGPLKERSTDISSVVKEIIDRPGWCGGNAMALFVTSDGLREALSHDFNEWEAPVLRVDYDPSSVNFSDTCLRESTTRYIADGADDVSEAVSDSRLDSDSDYLRTHIAGQEQIIGLRFDDVSIPKDTKITSAHIQLTSAGFTAGDANLNIQVESADNAAVYSSMDTIAGRSMSNQTIAWSNVPELAQGNKLLSPDLSSLVETTVGRANWTEDNAIAFSMKVAAGSTGERFFAAFDSPESNPVKLVVNYQVDSTSLAGQAIPLKIARDELIKTMLDLTHEGGTPLLDAYYEASQYMRGAAVDFGKERYSDEDSIARYFRVSHPDSYTNGELFQAPDCSTTDLNHIACATENIGGSPVYTAPEFGECQSNQIVLLSDGAANASGSAGNIRAVTGAASCESRDNSSEECGIELAQWLFDTDHDDTIPGTQSIITHTVGFNFDAPFLTDMATAGGGQFFPASSASDLADAFRNIIETAVSLDTSFVAPTTSISQTNRLVNSNDIYYAMFKPETTALWDGNLKRYQLGENTTTGRVEVLDALAAPAIDESTSTISSSARSFWSDSVDGSVVANGGAAEQLTLVRDLYVSLEDENGDINTLIDFHEDTSAITNDLLGIGNEDSAYRNNLLQWARGVDVRDFDGDGNTIEVRTQMGDPLHSSQHILTYANADGTNKSVIFVGTNHGFLHAINTDDGTEEFAYIPEDLLANLDVFYKDETIRHDKRPYGLDGEVSGWHKDTNDNGLVDSGEEAYIYVGMRRGGQNYYALDVSNIDSPDFQWAIKGGEGDFTSLGQTWSRPIKTQVTYNGTNRDVLIFAGGYDTRKDDQTERTIDDRGAAIYIVDAATGAHITSRDSSDITELRYSIPSDIRVVDVNSDGFADMLWVGDTGGQVWRFDINNLATSDADFLRGAVAAEFGNVGTVHNRRFFYEPDIALIRGDDGKVYMNVAIGSGFRAHPNDELAQDRFYAFRTLDVFGPPTDSDGVVDYSNITIDENDLVDVSTQSGKEDTSGDIETGWYFNLPDNAEKVLSSALTIDNTITFTTYVPAVDSANHCTVSIGTGRVYSVDAFFGDPAKEIDPNAPNRTENLASDRYVSLNTPGIPPRVTGLITESNSSAVTQLVGLQTVGDDEAGKPFERIFWAEE